jgi:hypothetical protein
MSETPGSIHSWAGFETGLGPKLKKRTRPNGHWKPVVLPNTVSFLRAWCASGCSFRRKKFLVSLLSLSSMTPVPHHQIAELPTVIKREKLSSMLIGITMVMFGAPLKA